MKTCGKDLDLEKARENIKITKELGVKIHLTFSLGLPGETTDSIKRTVAFAIEQDPDSLQFSIVTPFPGSKYFNELDEKGYVLSKNWEEYDGYNRAVIKTDYLDSCDLEKGLEYAKRAWRAHQLKKELKTAPFDYIKKSVSNPLHSARRFWQLFVKK